jgi:hypothetical protein
VCKAQGSVIPDHSFGCEFGKGRSIALGCLGEESLPFEQRTKPPVGYMTVDAGITTKFDNFC